VVEEVIVKKLMFAVSPPDEFFCSLIAFSALTLLVRRQEEHLACKN